MLVSYDLLLELETVLLRDKFRKRLSVSDVLNYVEYLRERATLIPSRTSQRPPSTPVVPDLDDQYLVYLAEDAQADRIVSGDKDFRGLSQADTPAEFLSALLQAQQERLTAKIPEYHRAYFSELRGQLERPEVFAEGIPDWMAGYKRVIAIGGRDGLLVIHVPVEKETILSDPVSGRRLHYIPAEPDADDDRTEDFIAFPDTSVSVLANSFSGGEEIDLDIPTDKLWGVKGFSRPQQVIDPTAGELTWTAPWTRLVAADIYNLSYFEDPERARAEAREDVEPYIRQE